MQIRKIFTGISNTVAEMRPKNWKTVFEKGPEVVQQNIKTGNFRSSMYDMCYGGTNWVPGNHWMA